MPHQVSQVWGTDSFVQQNKDPWSVSVNWKEIWNFHIFKMSFFFNILHVENSLEPEKQSKAKASLSTKLDLLINY